MVDWVVGDAQLGLALRWVWVGVGGVDGTLLDFGMCRWQGRSDSQ